MLSHILPVLRFIATPKDTCTQFQSGRINLLLADRVGWTEFLILNCIYDPTVEALFVLFNLRSDKHKYATDVTLVPRVLRLREDLKLAQSELGAFGIEVELSIIEFHQVF